MFIERKEYKLTHASESVTYDITDDYGHTAQLTPEQTETVYQWMASKSTQLHRDVQSNKPVEERAARWKEPPETSMSGFTFYNLVADLEKLKSAQEQAQIHLKKLGRTYASMKKNERFQQIETSIAASIEGYNQIIEKYTGMNRTADKSEEITQERIFSLIEQAIKELGDDATPIQVQVRLIQYGVDLPIEQVSGNMNIVHDTIDGEWE